jgi:hypothetical protein
MALDVNTLNTVLMVEKNTTAHRQSQSKEAI